MRRRQTGRMTTYSVIGTGGVGGFYGLNLVAAGCEVHFVIRSGARTGDVLRLRSPRGEIVARAGADCQVHSEIGSLPRVDVAIVAVKATANAEVLPHIAAAVKPGGAVLLIQNGMDAEHGYQRQVDQVIGGLAFLASYRESRTEFVHIDYGALTLVGFRPCYEPGGVTDAMQVVAADLGRSGVPVVLADDLLAARWQKLVWNIPFNGLSVVLEAETDALVANPASRRLAGALMAEVLAAAAADGRNLSADLPQQMLEMTDAMKPYAPSMRLDALAGRPMEVQAMYRAPIARAAAHGVAMPRTEALADALEFIDSRRR